MPVSSQLLLSSSHPALLAAAGTYLASLSFGFVIGYTVPAISSLAKDNIILSDAAYSWFGSLATLGALFACPFSGWLVEKYGRRYTLFLTTVIFIVGWITLIYGGIFLYAGRTLTGVASGMMTVVCPMYISEIATRESRGVYGSGVQLSITVGILVVYVCGLWIGWRGLALMGLLIGVFQFLAISRWSPESPRYLVLKNEKKKALRVLHTLRCASSSEIDDEFRDIEESVSNSDNKIRISELLCKPELRRPLIIALGLSIFAQLTGVNAVLFYMGDIFSAAGFHHIEWAPVIVGAVQVVATILSCYLMDRAGRRILLELSGVGITVSTFLLGLYYYFTFHHLDLNLEWMPLTMVIIFIIAFSLGYGPVPMLITSEIFPAQSRGITCSISTVIGWAAAFVVTKQFGALVVHIHEYGAFWVFSGFTAISIIFIRLLVPETRGKSLEDIEMFFLSSSAVPLA